MTPAQQKLYDTLIEDPERLLKMYSDYSDMLTMVDTAGWYAEQFAIADKERNELKEKVEVLKRLAGIK